MTTTALPSRSRRSSAARPSRQKRTVLPKPATADDVDRLHELARQLDGRPVPGVRMTEQQFEEWCDEDVKAEWVDGEVVLMSPENIVHLTLAQWLTFLLEE